MGILARLERRSSPENPSTSLAQYIDNGMMGAPTVSGTRITETSALNLSAVWAAVRVLTDMVASMPIHVYERLEPRGKKRAPGHSAYSLLHDRPNPEMSAFTFKEVCQGHLATWGNAYAEKERNGRGEVVALWPIPPSRVRTQLVQGARGITKVFRVSVDGSERVFSSDQIMHIPGFGYDGLTGYSPISFARESLGLAKAAEEFGARMFGQGLKTSGVFTHPGVLSDKARANLLKQLREQNEGLSNAHRMMLMEEGIQWHATSIPPDDAQFLETRKFQTTEIARWFKVPPHKLGDLDRATFSNIEHQSIEFVTDTARPWVVRWEQVLNWELFTPSQRRTYFAEFSMDALLRGDTEARGAFYNTMFQIGVLSQNDIREKENENPIEGGDRYWVQSALRPIDEVDDEPEPTPAAPEPDDPEDDEEDEEDVPMARLRPVLLDAAERILRREVDELRAAAKRGNVEAWADGFYFQDHAGFAAKRLLPACLAADAPTGARRAGELAADWASGALADLRRALKAGEEVEAVVRRWEADRAEGWVRRITNQGAA